MMGTTHLMSGFFLGVFITKFFEISNPYLFIFLITCFAALPDGDIITHVFYNKFKKPAFLKHLEHRKFAHSIYALIIATTLAYILFGKIGLLAALIGYTSHLFLDSFDVWGVPFFYPKKITITGPLTLYTKTEWAYYHALVIGSLFLIIKY